MFVGMGLSSVIPVLHGLELYGVKEMQDRIGLNWLVLEGVLYVLGAGLYAVSWSMYNTTGSADIYRLAGLNGPGLARLTSGEVPIRYFTCLLWQLLHRMCTAFSRLLTTIILHLVSNVRTRYRLRIYMAIPLRGKLVFQLESTSRLLTFSYAID